MNGKDAENAFQGILKQTLVPAGGENPSAVRIMRAQGNILNRRCSYGESEQESRFFEGSDGGDGL